MIDPAEITTAAKTDVGQMRKVNQDYVDEFSRDSGRERLLVIADGMGGHSAGDVASRMAVETVGEVFQDARLDAQRLLLSAFETANQRLRAAADDDDSLAGMGTTAVALLFARNGASWLAHVGDSRAYRLRDGQLVQLTDDHSVVGELQRLGRISPEQARTHPQRNQILRAIGTQSTIEVDLQRLDARRGDRFLTCSDGLYGMVHDEEIAEILGSESADDAVRMLVDLANDRGGSDNITVQLAYLGGSDETRAAPKPTAQSQSRSQSQSRQWLHVTGIWASALIGLGLLLFLLVRWLSA